MGDNSRRFGQGDMRMMMLTIQVMIGDRSLRLWADVLHRKDRRLGG
jgi:hypothetical protein